RGFAGGDNGLILKTTNEGALWYSQNSLTTEKINSIYFTDSLTGTVVGNNGLIITTITSGEIPTYKIITGNVRYEDNDNIVTGGWVRAIKYDTASGRIITIDSSAIS